VRVQIAAGLVVAAAWAGSAHACAQPRASAGETARIRQVLASGRDVLGERLLRAPGGPTYAAAARLLPPLLYARGSGGRPLTRSGVYYLPFSLPGSGTAFLHVADGSEILARRVGGPSLRVSVGGAPYGACLQRLATPQLAEGWLPILQTRYGAWRQESFAARDPASGRLAAFVRLSGPGVLRIGLLRGRGTLFVEWSGTAQAIDAAAYDAARAALAGYWRGRLDAAPQIDVPEPRVVDAERALLVQALTLGWRYSLGNSYEEFSWPESVDDAQVLAEYGFAAEAETALRASFDRRPGDPYANWKRGERLLTAAELARLSGDDSILALPQLRADAAALAAGIGDDGLLGRERFSSDIADDVYGLHAQAVAWRGLVDTGHAAAAARLHAGLVRAVRASARRLADGSLFVPVRLLDGVAPYGAITASRDGSYWNLVMPYALASGLLTHAQAEGVLRYERLHGGLLLGLVRAGAFALYGSSPRFPVSGTDEVYGLNLARFLGDLDEPDELVLALYGQLAGALTPGTFVAGEGATVAPLGGLRYRAMYLPPNATAGGSYLETLRQLLVHETADELDLAFATPRAWLAPGKHVAVTAMPTSFGPVSYTLDAAAGRVHAVVTVPPHPPRRLLLRLRLPTGTRTVDLSGRRGILTLELGVRRSTA
jgi:hypothetical protein